MSSSIKTIVLFGPQNTGKTSLFNLLTASKYQTVNYPGSTVSCTIGKLSEDTMVIDTPGVVSLIARSEDERIALNCLNHLDKINPSFSPSPDVVVLVLDGTQLKRQLVLYRQLKRAGITPKLIFTMKDILLKNGDEANVEIAKRILEDEPFFLDSRKKEGLEELKDNLHQLVSHPTKYMLNLPSEQFNKTTIEEDFAWAESIVNQFKPKKEKAFDLDSIFLHPIMGLVAFASVMTVLFWSIFSLSVPLMDSIDGLVGSGIGFVQNSTLSPIVKAFLSEGLLASLGSVIIFVPQIAILFFLIGIMEGTGYLARGAALIDKPLASLGLNGRSFVPLLSGCACAIPAMMAARSIPNSFERKLTLWIIPLMQCSARLPVYGLLLILLLGNQPKWIGGVIMTGIYFGGVVLAALAAKFLAKVLPEQHPSTGFIIELPKWRFPLLKPLLVNTYHQTMGFIKKAGPTIFVVGLSLWALSQFPNPEHSIAVTIGQWMSPLWAPLGVDWRVGVALLLSFAAREVFVSALAVMFAAEAGNGLIQALSNATTSTGEPLFTVPVILGLIVFFMISMQCLSTVAVAVKEMGGWKMPIIMTGTYIILGYTCAVLTTFFTKFIISVI